MIHQIRWDFAIRCVQAGAKSLGPRRTPAEASRDRSGVRTVPRQRSLCAGTRNDDALPAKALGDVSATLPAHSSRIDCAPASISTRAMALQVAPPDPASGARCFTYCNPSTEQRTRRARSRRARCVPTRQRTWQPPSNAAAVRAPQ